MTISQLGQIALPVADADRAEDFYQNKLGLEKLFRFGGLVFFSCGNVRLMLEETAEPVAPASGVCHYFVTSGLDAETKRLQAQGVVFSQEPHLIATMPDHELWMSFFADPDGHMLALMEERRN